MSLTLKNAKKLVSSVQDYSVDLSQMWGGGVIDVVDNIPVTSFSCVDNIILVVIQEVFVLIGWW